MQKTKKKQSQSPKDLKSLKGIKTLSELIELALKDLRKQERLEAKGKSCRVAMDMWWVVAPDACAVCLAGSVMKYSIGLPKQLAREVGGDSIPKLMQHLQTIRHHNFTRHENEEEAVTINPGDYDKVTEQRLYALNCIREGKVGTALIYFHRRAREKKLYERTFGWDHEVCMDMPDYHFERKEWYKGVRKIIKQLKSLGL